MFGQAITLTLVCYGVSDTPTAQTAFTTANGGMHTAQTTITGRQRTGDRLTVEVRGNDVRVRGPQSLQPPISGGGADGWRAMTGVSITDREIRGQISYNWVNKPMVRIDRVTGEIEMRNVSLVAGKSGFTGECERFNDQPRF